MLSYSDLFVQYVNKIKSEGRYRDFVTIERDINKSPIAYCNNKKIVLWCINDYLNMSQNDLVLNAASNAIVKYGIGSGGTRNIAGNNICLVELELELANLHNKDMALVFSSGYIANDETLSTISKIIPGIVFFSDEFNHASIISGIRRFNSEKYVYHHLDIQHLEYLLKKIDINKPKIIVFESIYSMDGLFSPVKEIVDLAKKYNALTFIDEVHAVGLYGIGGSGIASLHNCSDQIDIIQGTLSKAYGTLGGYITGNRKIIDSIRLSASGFIFTTSLPPSIAAAATASIRYLKNSNIERITHNSVVSKVKECFNNMKIPYLVNNSHIIPIIIGDPIKVKDISNMLLNNYNIYVQHINFPTVPRGTERLRITPIPAHDDIMINNLANAIKDVLTILNIK